MVFVSDRDADEGFNLEIYLLKDVDEEPVRLTNKPLYDLQPAWSPDGSRIAFLSPPDDVYDVDVISMFGVYDIYTMFPDGSDVVNLTNNPGSHRFPTWSPDGKKIAFASHAKGEVGGIFVMNADGSDLTLLNPTVSHDGIQWSLDGSKIAFRDREYLYTMNSDGSELFNVTENLVDIGLDSFFGLSVYSFSLSPDGETVAIGYTGLLTEGSNIAVVGHDGKTLRYIQADEEVDEMSPSFSPDGEKMVFILSPNLLCFVDTASWSPYNLVCYEDRMEISGVAIPEWTADGNFVAYLVRDDAYIDEHDIHVMRTDGSEVITITHDSNVNDFEFEWAMDLPTRLKLKW